MAKAWHVFKDAAGREPFKRIDPQSGQNVPRRFRFTLAAGLALEDQVGSGLNQLLSKGQNVTALVKTLYHGFTWEDPRLTEAQVLGALQVFIDQGGDSSELYDQMIEALNASGTFGRAKPKGDPFPAPAADEAAADSSGEGQAESLTTT